MIRIAEIDDIKRIDDIYNQAIEHKFQTADTSPWDMEQRLLWFENHNPITYPVTVYVQNDQILGWASLSKYRDGRKALSGAVEVSFYLDHKSLGQGIGSRLLTDIIERAKRLNYMHIFSILLGTNKASIALLEKFQFNEWGRLPKIAKIDGIYCDHLYYGRPLKLTD